MFAHIQETEANKVDSPKPQDLSGDCLSTMGKLMLAQARVVVAAPAAAATASCL